MNKLLIIPFLLLFADSLFSQRSQYSFDVELHPTRKSLSVTQELKWINNGGATAYSFYLHLYPNAYSSSASVYMGGRVVPPNSITRMRFTEFKIASAGKNYFEPLLTYPHAPDSTVAVIDLAGYGGVPPGSSVDFRIKYTLRIPEAYGRFGHSADQNLYWIAQWYPKPGVFQNGNWECQPFFRFSEFFSEFADYKINLTLPSAYTPVLPGEPVTSVKENRQAGKKTYEYRISRVHNLAWGAVREYLPAAAKYLRRDGSTITVSAFLLPYNDANKNRALNAVLNTLDYFEKHIAPYPYSTLSIVDVPGNSGVIASMEYPGVITYNTGYFIPDYSLELEKVIVHEVAHQFFYGIVANNEVAEAWLDEAFANYFTTKILGEYYPPEKSFFRLFGYYPVPGFVLLQQSEIPVIYTLSSFEVPLLAYSLSRYYRNPEAGSLSSPSWQALSWQHYTALNYSKGELLLHALERQTGEKEFLQILKGYYEKYAYRHPTGEDFWNFLRTKSGRNLEFLYNGFYKGSGKGDYKVTEIRRAKGSVSVRVERSGEGIFPSEVQLQTTGGTFKMQWSGEERVKILKFKTHDFPISAEIDPERKNPFDINYANNSMTVELQIMGSLSISLKWFFWMQNFLMIMGGLA